MYVDDNCLFNIKKKSQKQSRRKEERRESTCIRPPLDVPLCPGSPASPSLSLPLWSQKKKRKIEKIQDTLRLDDSECTGQLGGSLGEEGGGEEIPLRFGEDVAEGTGVGVRIIIQPNLQE